MTALFEMRIRMGGDPRGYSEFKALCDEVGKLNHPACPDVDWARVEQLCLALFQQNGAEMHSACFYTLACGQRYGLEGITQGVTLLEALSREWPNVWPAMASVRLDLLGWLFDQLKLLLRGMVINTHSVPALVHLDAELSRLQARLCTHSSGLQLTLQALHHQVSSLIQHLDQTCKSGEMLLAPIRTTPAALMTPVLIVLAPEMKARVRRLPLWVSAGFLSVALGAGVGWRVWLAGPDSEAPLPEPVRLDSLSLFDAGSTTLRPESTKVLINALVGIKAQPGWLIMISGHTDSSGVYERNLALSHARASAVRDWMQRMGDINDSCLAVRGLAANQPIASNETEAGRAANRRVDIHLLPQAGACEQVVAEVEYSHTAN